MAERLPDTTNLNELTCRLLGGVARAEDALALLTDEAEQLLSDVDMTNNRYDIKAE